MLDGRDGFVFFYRNIRKISTVEQQKKNYVVNHCQKKEIVKEKYRKIGNALFGDL